MNVEILNVAESELLDAIAYYEAEQKGLGKRFLNEFERGRRKIEHYPHAWSKVSRRSRRYRLRRFPYGLVYQVVGDTALILAVMHLHRKPDTGEIEKNEITYFATPADSRFFRSLFGNVGAVFSISRVTSAVHPV